MADHLTEEEQVEALKRWWNENWVSVVLPIILVLCGYMGWNLWKNHQQAGAEAASSLYQQLSQAAAATQPGEALSAEQKTKIGELAEQVISEHGGSLYADMSSLLLARIHVEDGQMASAQQRLESVASNGANESVRQVATARLARVLSALGEHDKALSLVAQPDSEAFKALFAEVRGDIYLAQGKAPEANSAYQQAMDSLPASEFNRRSLLELKQNAVAMPTAPLPEPEALSAETAEGDA